MITPYPGWPWAESRLLDLDIEPPPVSFREWLTLYAAYRDRWGSGDYRPLQPTLGGLWDLKEYLHNHDLVELLHRKRLVTVRYWKVRGWYEGIENRDDFPVVKDVTPMGLEVLHLTPPTLVSEAVGADWIFSEVDLLKSGEFYGLHLAEEHWPESRAKEFFLEHAGRIAASDSLGLVRREHYEAIYWPMVEREATDFLVAATKKMEQLAARRFIMGAKRYLEEEWNVPTDKNTYEWQSLYRPSSAVRQATEGSRDLLSVAQILKAWGGSDSVSIELTLYDLTLFTTGVRSKAVFQVEVNGFGTHWLRFNASWGLRDDGTWHIMERDISLVRISNREEFPDTGGWERSDNILAAALIAKGHGDRAMTYATGAAFAKYQLDEALEAIDNYVTLGEANQEEKSAAKFTKAFIFMEQGADVEVTGNYKDGFQLEVIWPEDKCAWCGELYSEGEFCEKCARCRVATGETPSLWECDCRECTRLQHEWFEDESDPAIGPCTCRDCDPDGWNAGVK